MMVVGTYCSRHKLKMCVGSNNHHFHLCVVYRPPPSKGNQYKASTFFEEWSEFLDNFVITQGELRLSLYPAVRAVHHNHSEQVLTGQIYQAHLRARFQ
jgi:hypothetical protein